METGGRRRVEGEQEFFSSFWGGRNLKRREDAGCQDYPAILLTAQAELPSHCPGRSSSSSTAARRSYQCPLLIATRWTRIDSTAFAAGGSPDWVRLSLTSSVRTLRNRPKAVKGGSVERESDVGAEQSRQRERERRCLVLVVCSLLYTTLLEQALAFNFHSQARPCCQYPATPASFSAVSLPITSFLFRRRYYSPSTLLFPMCCPSSFFRNIGAPP
ncbi:hypothetical protein An16g05080 [Aspergillus niger]|uniref:Uncharacterized protein n=2 Tax=Aspergillus niger TaxID=5061 RepID=A2R7X4_ASPNC|nr:hypothetical protein An16g05080 [Aspergillus niger]CAK97362.1 hypothetical protein An16g05080 [Aspergillus niger]